MQLLDVARVALAVIAGYLIGGIPFGIIVPRLIGGTDPRTIGSGRTGGANVSRAVGYRWAAVSGLLDVAKASVIVLLIAVLGGGVVAQVAAALSAIIGHSRSPFIGFHGGRGVAPATGGAIILAPIILVAIFPVFALSILITRISSIGSLSASLIGGLAMVVIAAVTGLPPIYYVYGVGVPGLIWLFHVDNIQRLVSGQERRIGRGPGAADGLAGAETTATAGSAAVGGKTSGTTAGAGASIAAAAIGRPAGPIETAPGRRKSAPAISETKTRRSAIPRDVAAKPVARHQASKRPSAS